MARDRITVVGQWIEFDDKAVAMLKPHAKPGELMEFIDYLNGMVSADAIDEANVEIAREVKAIRASLDEIVAYSGIEEEPELDV